MSNYQAADVLAASSSTTVITLPAFTLTGSNRNIAAFALHRAGTERQITGIVRGSDTFSESGETKQGNAKTELYNSTNEPGTGSATLAITINSANTTWCAGYIASDDVNQTTRINGVVHNESASAGSLSVNVTSASGDLVCSAIAVSGDIGGARTLAATGTNHTKRAEDKDSGNLIFGGAGSKPGETTAAVGFSWTTATLECVLYGWNHPAASSPPVNTLPSSGKCINTYAETDVPGISVAEGSASVVSVATTCTAGCTLTYDTTGTSVTISGNGTNAATLSNGASITEYNTVLGTLTMRGSTPDTTITVTVIPTDGTLNDSDQFTVLCDPAGITITGTNNNVVAAVASLQIRLLAGQTHDTISVNVVDDTGGTPLESDSDFIVGLASYFSPSTGAGIGAGGGGGGSADMLDAYVQIG